MVGPLLVIYAIFDGLLFKNMKFIGYEANEELLNV